MRKHISKILKIFVVCIALFPSLNSLAGEVDEILKASDDPLRMLSLVGRNSGYGGANCINAALVARYPKMGLRHVSEAEGQFLMSRDFNEVLPTRSVKDLNPSTLTVGDVLVYDHFAHLALYVGDGKIFFLAGWGPQYSYSCTPLEDVHKGDLPPIGGDPVIRLSSVLWKAEPYQVVSVHRFLRSNREEKPSQEHQLLVETWSPFLNTANAMLGDRLMHHPRKQTPISAMAYESIQDFNREWRERVKKLNRESELMWGSDFLESFARLESLLDGYQAFIDQYFFSSVHMTTEKYLRINHAHLVPSIDREEDRLLVQSFLKAKSDERSVEDVHDSCLKVFEVSKKPSLFKL